MRESGTADVAEEPERSHQSQSKSHADEGEARDDTGGLADAMSRAAEAHPEDIDKQIEVALQCPCVEDMMRSPCKDTFVDSFTCFMKSDHPEVKGYDCVEHFERFQTCLVANPGVIDEFLSNKSETEPN